MIELLIVFLSDMAISYLGAKTWNARFDGRLWSLLGYNALLDLAINVNQLGIDDFRLLCFPFSILGSAIGLYLGVKKSNT